MRDFIALFGITHQIAQQLAAGGRVEVALCRHIVNRHRVPPRQGGQGSALQRVTAQTQQRHQRFERQHDIEVITADAAAAVAKQAGTAIGLITPLRTHQQHGAVGGSAADIHHQHACLLLQCGFKLQTGGNRLELKLDVAESGTLCGTQQNALRLLVGVFTAQPLEVDWPANHGLINRLIELGFTLLANVQHHGAHQIFKEGDLLGFQAAGTEERLRRFDEPHLFRIDHIVLQRGQTKLHAGRRHLDILFAVITQRALQQRGTFAVWRGDLMVAVQPFTDGFARGRANHGGKQALTVFQGQ